MKISIIATEDKNPHVQALRRVAQAQGIECVIHDIVDINDLSACVARLGDVIVWRSASLPAVARTALLRRLKDRVVINQALADFPYNKYKFYQQKVVEAEERMSPIPTYQFSTLLQLESAIASDVLRFPFVAKPNLGACGRGVVLIKDEKQLATLPMIDMVYQNYIANNGDYRVILLGGKPLGVIKRTAATGDFRNNLSQGATGVAEHSVDVVAAVTAIAQRAASMFGLQLCGVDVLRDLNGKYYFLEINSVPQWDVFQECTGVDVAEEIVRYALQMQARLKKTLPTVQLVTDFTIPSLTLSPAKAFHYYSRLFLWTGREEYRHALARLESTVIKTNAAEQERVIMANLSRPLKKYTEQATGRDAVLARFPLLRRYQHVLIRALFAKTIYGKRPLPVLKRAIDMNVLRDMRHAFLQNPELIMSLSTPAVNTLYFMQHLFGREFSVDPARILQAARTIPAHTNRKALTERLYLFTHVIIAASAFYSKRITTHKTVYRAIMKEAEQLIADNYTILRLDAKLEFVVAARILGYKSHFCERIIQEAEQSLSLLGNYVIDKSIDVSVRDHFLRAEHRNVLYLMAKEPWRLTQKK